MIWLIVLVLIFVAALNWAFRAEASLRRAMHWAIVTLLTVCVVLSATGLVKAISPAPNSGSMQAVDNIHRWVGVMLPIVIGGLAPLFIAIGVRWLTTSGKRWHGALQVAASLGVFALSFLASVTGYIGPTYMLYDGPMAAESLLRFRVYHMGIFPVMLVGTLVAWLVIPWWSRRRASWRSEAIAMAGEDSDNPYQSPSSGV